MIHEIIPLVAGELRDFLVAKFDTAGDVVKLSNLVSQDGSIAINEENVVVVSLMNIERDGSNQWAGSHSFANSNVPVHINLYVMFSAYFSDYAESLKFISGVIGFFQAYPNYMHDGNNIKIEMYNIDFKELSNFWTSLGAKYLPSVIYKFRTIGMDEGRIRNEIPPVTGITA
jgi:Pvc16 N-terminal domain